MHIDVREHVDEMPGTFGDASERWMNLVRAIDPVVRRLELPQICIGFL